MPQNLNNRLEQLEREIYDLLRIQQQQCSEIQDLVPCQYNKQRTPCTIQRVKSGIPAPSTHQNTQKSCTKTKSTIAANSTPENIICIDQTSYPEELTHYKKCENKNYYRNVPPKVEENEYCLRAKKQLCEEKEKVEAAYQIIEDLKEELQYSKARMCTMAKDMATLSEALQSLRTKYKNIKIFRKDAIAQIEELKTINSELCKKLENEMKNHAESIKNIRAQENSKAENKVKREASQILQQTKEQFRKIQEANEKMRIGTQELQKKYAEAKKEIDYLKETLNNNTNELESATQETEDIKLLLSNERNKNSIISDAIDKLEETVQNMIKTEKKSQKEMNDLKQQIEDLEQCKCIYKQSLTEKEEENNKLKCVCEKLGKDINELSTQDSSKCKRIENEINRLKEQMKEKEYILQNEKNTLKELVQELSNVVKRHKTRIRELVHINRQQEALLKSQMVILRNKEHQVKMAEVEVEAAKHKTDNLEEQIDKLRHTLQSYESIQKLNETDCKCKIERLEGELEETKNYLEKEQEKLLIKEKIIDDQADTIQKLKTNVGQRGDELKKNSTEIAKLQKELEGEKYEKDLLKASIEDIEWHKEQLKDQITDLQAALKEKSAKPEKLEKHKKLLISLEQQVSMKQREWELRCKLLSTEKKRAVQAAKFATQKLVDTVNDFQSHTQSQKKMQAMLTNIVQSKNKELQCACRKYANQ